MSNKLTATHILMARAALGLSQEDFANRSGLGVATIRRLEINQDKVLGPKVESLVGAFFKKKKIKWNTETTKKGDKEVVSLTVIVDAATYKGQDG